MNVPNFLSIIRILSIPLLIIFLTNNSKAAFIILLIVVGLTDFFDGYIARKFKKQTRLGMALDSVADKLLILSSFIALAAVYKISLLKLSLIFFREFIVIIGSIFIGFKKGKIEFIESMPATYLGKITTAIQIITLAAVVLNIYPAFFIWLTIVLSLAAGSQYLFIGSKLLSAKI